MKIIHVNSEKDLNKFNKMVKKGKMLVVFVANWCGHCQHLKPIWFQMEKKIKKNKCVKKGIIAMIYSDYKDRVNVSSNCNGFPTIRMYKDGQILKDWDGDWTSKNELEKSAKGFFGTTKKGKSKKITRRRSTKRNPKRNPKRGRKRNNYTRRKRRR